MRFVSRKKFTELEKRFDRLIAALEHGQVHILAAQTNVAAASGGTTLITEGPTAGETRLKGGQFVIILTNPSGK